MAAPHRAPMALLDGLCHWAGSKIPPWRLKAPAVISPCQKWPPGVVPLIMSTQQGEAVTEPPRNDQLRHWVLTGFISLSHPSQHSVFMLVARGLSRGDEMQSWKV